MTPKAREAAAKLLRRLCEDPAARLVAQDKGYAFAGPAGGKDSVAARLVRALISDGLLYEAEPGRVAAGAVAQSWLKRHDEPGLGFPAQHRAVAAKRLDGATVLVNLEESPIAGLARHRGPNGEPWLAAHAAAAAERLRRDFEIGQLQPRITANWSASINSGRRAADGGAADLTDMALAARLRFDAAMRAAGPELSGVIVDVCCFLKGLELVERERQWPARSAKLVLRLGLESLARHYGLAPAATGAARGGIRHWGAEGYRPDIT